MQCSNCGENLFVDKGHCPSCGITLYNVIYNQNNNNKINNTNVKENIIFNTICGIISFVLGIIFKNTLILSTIFFLLSSILLIIANYKARKYKFKNIKTCTLILTIISLIYSITTLGTMITQWTIGNYINNYF